MSIPVLIVDDEDIIRFALREILQCEGSPDNPEFEVHEARNGQEGLAQFRTLKPACTILDLRMPGLDGHGFLAELSEEEIRQHPVIILTGHGDLDELQRCYDRGAMLFLRKPFNEIELLSAVKSAVASHAFHSQQRKLREQEIERLTAIIELTPMAVVLVDGQGLIRYINPAVRKLVFRPRPILKSRITDLWPPMEVVQQLLDGGMDQVHRIVRCDCAERKEPLWLDVMAFPMGRMTEADERFTTWMIRDITDQRALEDRYHHAERLKSTGTLAAGVAHDFNNILNIILSYVGICELDAEPDSQMAINLGNIQQAAFRARDVVQQLQVFSRQVVQNQQSGCIELNQAVKDSVNLVKVSLKGIDFGWSLCEEKLPVEGNPTELQQILSNLCINAWHATRDQSGGKVFVTLERAPAGNEALIQVRDNGHGIPSENLARIFDPFFTTKPPGEGEGLGLSVVHGLITRMGGRIECLSRTEAPDHGTVFNIWLPLCAE